MNNKSNSKSDMITIKCFFPTQFLHLGIYLWLNFHQSYLVAVKNVELWTLKNVWKQLSAVDVVSYIMTSLYEVKKDIFGCNIV